MNRLMAKIMAVAVFCAAASVSSAALAQGGPQIPQYNPPVISPYLNLFPSTNAGGPLAYQSLVLPQLQQNAFNYQSSNALNTLQGQLNQLRSSSGFATTGTQFPLRPTGHPAAYLDYSHFYPLIHAVPR